MRPMILRPRNGFAAPPRRPRRPLESTRRLRFAEELEERLYLNVGGLDPLLTNPAAYQPDEQGIVDFSILPPPPGYLADSPPSAPQGTDPVVLSYSNIVAPTITDVPDLSNGGVGQLVSFQFANGFLLLLVTFVPFPTAVLAEYLERPAGPVAKLPARAPSSR